MRQSTKKRTGTGFRPQDIKVDPALIGNAALKEWCRQFRLMLAAATGKDIWRPRWRVLRSRIPDLERADKMCAEIAKQLPPGHWKRTKIQDKAANLRSKASPREKQVYRRKKAWRKKREAEREARVSAAVTDHRAKAKALYENNPQPLQYDPDRRQWYQGNKWIT